MKTWIVSYADASFRSAQEQLMASAARFGIDLLRPWNRTQLEQTPFYRWQKDILDQRRGGGFWLWKPYVINETLKEIGPDDCLIYADSGFDIVADLSPLFDLFTPNMDIMIFASHFDDERVPGPPYCSRWAKRDCLVFMDCDEPRYHQAEIVDAGFILLHKTPRAIAFVREWLLYCCQRQILTSEPSVCGLPELPDFIGHLNDQAVLSLLAKRAELERFRHPSQRGNHAKEERFREPGEWTRFPYGAKGIYANSPYGTLLNHHRGFIGQSDLTVSLRRTLPGLREQVFAAWTRSEILGSWSPPDFQVVAAEADVRVGGSYHVRLADARVRAQKTKPPLEIVGTYLEVQPPARLTYSAPLNTQVSVEFRDQGSETAVALEHGRFPSERVRENWVVLWNSFLDHLARHLAG
jgi:uncharacterized protein YndB with AHSA1/START domain